MKINAERQMQMKTNNLRSSDACTKGGQARYDLLLVAVRNLLANRLGFRSATNVIEWDDVRRESKTAVLYRIIILRVVHIVCQR